MNCAEKRFYQKKPLSPGCRCVVFLAVLSFFCLQTEYTGHHNYDEIKVALQADYFEVIFNGEKQCL